MQPRFAFLPRPQRLRTLLFWLVPALALAVGIGFWYSPRSVPPLVVTSAPASGQIEAQWGVRISHIGVTADGGLIDLRYLVLDPAKATLMLESLETMPKIVAADQSTTLSLRTAHHHKGNLEAGRSYYILYRNVAGSVTAHTAVTVVVGDLRLAGFPVE